MRNRQYYAQIEVQCDALRRNGSLVNGSFLGTKYEYCATLDMPDTGFCEPQVDAATGKQPAAGKGLC